MRSTSGKQNTSKITKISLSGDGFELLIISQDFDPDDIGSRQFLVNLKTPNLSAQTVIFIHEEAISKFKNSTLELGRGSVAELCAVEEELEISVRQQRRGQKIVAIKLLTDNRTTSIETEFEFDSANLLTAFK